jgi:hypothetical protein
VHSGCLVVQAWFDPELHGSATNRELKWQQVTTIKLLAVRTYRIDLARFVTAMDEAVPPAAATPGSNHHNATLLDCPLALDSEQPWPKIEDQVVPLVVEWQSNAETELERKRSDLRLGEGALLVRRQHGQHSTRSVGRTVVY